VAWPPTSAAVRRFSLEAVRKGERGQGGFRRLVLLAVWDDLAWVGVGVIDRRGKGVVRMTQGKERTKEQLLREAKKLGITGRSKMSKGALKAAVDRRS
jgi:hypothetical protein